jgi:hypothetical protein
MKVYFDKANNLYQQTLRPMLEAQHSLKFADAAALPANDPKRTALRNDDRLIKTLLLAALAPAVESLKNMTPQRLAALNHGTIRSFVPGQEAQLVLQRCKDWAARVGQLSVQEGAGGVYTISLQVTDLDMRPILERAESVDNHGNRVARMKGLIFEALGMPDHQELFFRYPFRWRGTDREAEVLFGNVREMSDDQLETRGNDWKIIIDYPFDRSGHNLTEDLERLSQFRSLGAMAENRTVCWLPGFLNHEAQKPSAPWCGWSTSSNRTGSAPSSPICLNRTRPRPGRSSKASGTNSRGSSGCRSRRSTDCASRRINTPIPPTSSRDRTTSSRCVS